MSGELFGPVDIVGLRHWVAEGRIGPDTILIEDGTGRELPAKFVYELGLSSNMHAEYGMNPPAMPRRQTNFAAISIACSALAFFVCGFCLIPAFYYAYKAGSMRESNATFAKVVVWITTIVYVLSTAYLLTHMEELQRMLGL